MRKIYVVYILSVLLFACLGLLVNSFDSLINNTLYDYGLQFSEEWYQQYKMVNTAFWVTFFSMIILTFIPPLSVYLKKDSYSQESLIRCSVCGKRYSRELDTCPYCHHITREDVTK